MTQWGGQMDNLGSFGNYYDQTRLNCVLLTCRIYLNTNCGFPGVQIGEKVILEKPSQFFVMTENPKIFPRYLRMSQGSFYEQVHPKDHSDRV